MIVEGAPTSIPPTNVQLGGGPEADAETAQTTKKGVMVANQVVSSVCKKIKYCPHLLRLDDI